MRKEESNKTKDNLVETDMVLSKVYSLANIKKYYLGKKKQQRILFFLSLFVYVMGSVEEMKTIIWKKNHNGVYIGFSFVTLEYIIVNKKKVLVYFIVYRLELKW